MGKEMTPEQLLKLQLFHAELRSAELYKDWGKVAILLRELDSMIKEAMEAKDD